MAHNEFPAVKVPNVLHKRLCLARVLGAGILIVSPTVEAHEPFLLENIPMLEPRRNHHPRSAELHESLKGKRHVCWCAGAF
jgi:hypothetical protein